MYLYQIFVGGRHPHVIELVKGYELIVELVVYIPQSRINGSHFNSSPHTDYKSSFIHVMCTTSDLRKRNERSRKDILESRTALSKSTFS